MSYVLQLRGKLSEIRRKKMELVTAANSHADAIKGKLATSAISSVEELDADAVLYHARELKAARDKVIEVSGEIRTIKKELGEE